MTLYEISYIQSVKRQVLNILRGGSTHQNKKKRSPINMGPEMQCFFTKKIVRGTLDFRLVKTSLPYNYVMGSSPGVCSFSNPSVTPPTSQLILQPFRHSTYVTTHSPTLPSLYLRHSSFYNPSVASPTSQFILQPSFRFFYVTSSSPNSPGEPTILPERRISVASATDILHSLLYRYT